MEVEKTIMEGKSLWTTLEKVDDKEEKRIKRKERGKDLLLLIKDRSGGGHHGRKGFMSSLDMGIHNESTYLVHPWLAAHAWNAFKTTSTIRWDVRTFPPHTAAVLDGDSSEPSGILTESCC